MLGGGRGRDVFLLAREHFNSKVEYQRLDVHDISPDAIGTFDIVFCAGVLYHLRHPLLGLERIRSVTGGELILETSSLILAFHESTPLITFFPGDADASKFEWHHRGFPTRAWVSQMADQGHLSSHSDFADKHRLPLRPYLTGPAQARRRVPHHRPYAPTARTVLWRDDKRNESGERDLPRR
jgi:Protein of unknown function (DUF1698)